MTLITPNSDIGILWQHCEGRHRLQHISIVVLGQPGDGCKDFSTKNVEFLVGLPSHQVDPEAVLLEA